MKAKIPKPRKVSETTETEEKLPSGICHSLQAWATECGMDPETLKKALVKVDYRHVPNSVIPFKAIRLAIYGEMYAEELRGKKLDNDKKERAARKADGSLCEWEMVEKITNESFVLPLIAAFDSAPDSVSRDWIEKVLKPVMRTKLQQPKL